MPLIANFATFQINWFACVLGGAHGLPWLGTGFALALIAVHLAWVARPRPELTLIVLTGLLGATLDSAWVSLGLLEFPSGILIEGTAPHWIVAMWMAFATTLNITFRWLKGRLLLAGLLGTVGGPLAYYAGAELGGVSFPSPALSLSALALSWGLAMPALIALSHRFDGTAETDRKSASRNGSDTARRQV